MSEKIYKGADGPSNAAKAARKALGADAKRGLDFEVIKVEGGAVWRARDLAKTAEMAVSPPAPSQDDAAGQAMATLGIPVSTEADVDREAHKEVPARPARKAHPSDPPKTLAAYAGADHFTTVMRLGPADVRKEEHKTLAEAAARAFELRQEHKGRDCLVYAVSKQFPGGDIPVPRSVQQEASVAHINANPSSSSTRKAPAKKAAKAAEKTERPLGKRAQIEADARAGKLPKAPDFSAETHTRFRPKLKEVVDLVKAGDIKGLKSYKINTVSSSPKAIDRYRKLAILALEARK